MIAAPTFSDKIILENNMLKAETFLANTFRGKPIRKILFINPPDNDSSMFNYEDANRKNYYNYPPYGFAIIARHLINHGYDVEIHDLNLSVLEQCHKSNNALDFDFDTIWQSKLQKTLSEFRPDLVGVTCMFTMTHRSFINVCKQIKSTSQNWLGSDSPIPLAIGGVHITQSLERVLKDLPEAEFAFLYEAEEAFLKFIEIADNKRPTNELSQIVINTPAGKLEFDEPDRPEADGLNFLPAYELLEMKKYSSFGRIGAFRWSREKDTRFATALSNRGCRAACTFCSVRHFNGVGVRHRSVESVVDELQFLRDSYGIGHIMWLDDDLFHDETRAISLFNEMTRRNLGVTWDASNGVIAYSCKEEVLDAAAKSGCVGLNIGVESGNPQILRDIKKPGTVETFLAAAGLIKKYDKINSRAFLMIGFPHESYRMIMDTLNLALKMNLDWYNITVLEPLPHTPIFEAMVDQELASSDFEEPEGRYNSGPHGRQSGIGDEKVVISQEEFWEMFSESALDNIPPKNQMLDIWFYANYYLNFYSLFHMEPSAKLTRQAKYVKNICENLAPNNPFAIYFHIYLQQRLYGVTEHHLTIRLETRLASSLFWKKAFDELGLSVEHLKKQLTPCKPKIEHWLEFYNSVSSL